MSMTLDDAEVIRCVRAGNDAVFAAVVDEYRPELLRHARRRTPDSSTAEDLVQETFVRAYRAFGRLPDDSRVRPWLHQILRNVCIDDAHRRQREHDKLERVGADMSWARFDNGPEETLGLDVDSSALGAAMTGLPETHRVAFVNRVVDGLEYDEIAARAGVTETNARARVSRARSALRRAMQGVAAIPVACYLLLRRPGRQALAAPPNAAAPGASGSPTIAAASRLANSVAPAVDVINGAASGGSHTVPLLAKAAIGIGAVATMSLATAPESPPPPADPVATTIADVAAAPSAAPAPQALVPAPAAAPTAVAALPPVVSAAPTTTLASTTTVAAATAPATTAAPSVAASPAPGAPVPVDATPVDSTTPPSTAAPTTVTVATTLPPLTGGSVQASVSATPAGPRVDLSGSATLTVGGVPSSGSLSGRIGIADPDPAGSRRVDGTVTISLGNGAIELRLAGYGTSSQAVPPGTSPTEATMSGAYRASGATGQLVTSGSFSATLTGSTLSLTLSA